jgi:hypothetical protein
MSKDAYNRYGAGVDWRYDIEEFGFGDNLTDIARPWAQPARAAGTVH